MTPLVVEDTPTNRITRDDLDILSRIVAWTASHNLYFIVKGHVEAVLASLRDVRVRDVELVMTTGRTRKSFTVNNVQAVLVKLSDGGVINVRVGVTYVTENVTHLRGEVVAKEVEEQKWYVYVVRCNDNSLYCGISKNVENRVAEHNGNSRGAKYTRSRRPVTLVKQWKLKNKSEALKAEKRFKKLSKERKEEICAPTIIEPST